MKNEAAGSSKFASDLAPAAISNLQVVIPHRTAQLTRAALVYARDWEQGFRRSLAPGSLVLMTIKRSWWRTSDKRLAARLRKIGHQIVWVESE